MRRRRRSRSWVYWLMLMSVFFVVIRVMGPLSADVAGRPHSAVRDSVSQNAAPVLELSATGWTWNGRPVYRVQNLSNRVLSHVSITSWQGDLLPLLAISRESPKSMPEQPLAQPPYQVPPGNSAWFVGEDEGRPRYVVSWLANGEEAYEVVTTRLVSPA
ncbi:hypothetical protein Heshes_06400 [Alicyclobacillus hesperidum]|uniref:Uncharacterized protein n=1 Tax=Alicyclobacillus hesperidum TaxID=89784 RepID=A0A1H2VLJ3_9BACL|nr:hypothetical protein [Alicyclobacillus hesperidum]GLV12956.1 hypothetical protein Heshes_06400 [Alicyclobacillus hesperidum]SDW69203.1 hypothetical protein SAMN04489725_11169 [Alicyclobacillus hesperidum]